MSGGFDCRKILIVRNDNLGDVLCTTPAIEALKRSYPESFVGILVADYTRCALEGNPYADRIFSYSKAKHGAGRWRSAGSLMSVFSKIRAEKFGVAIAMRSRLTPVLSALVRLSGAETRIGFSPADDRRRLGRRLTHLVDPPDRSTHEVERCMLLSRVLAPDARPGRLKIYLDAGEKTEARSRLAACGVAPGVRPVCVHVSSRRSAGRYWPTSHYIDLVQGLHDSGFPVVLNCAPQEKESGRIITSRLTKPVPSVETRTVRELGALFGECSVVATLHGGGAHLSVAAGTPTVAVFNGGDRDVWAPWGPGHRAVASLPEDPEVGAERVLREIHALLKY